MRVLNFIILALCTVSTVSALSFSASAKPKRVAVFGGTGYVGSKVCERLVKKGYVVTAVSRRGENPKPGDANLDQVKWVKGDATDASAVKKVVNDADAVVHAIGLLFDVDSGLANLNTIVSGSGSLPGDDSTYDNITRQTMFNIASAIEGKMAFSLGNQKFPLCFVSAAEAGWPEVAGGSFIEEKIAPEWLKVSYRTSNIFHCLLKKLIILQNPRRNILLRSVRSRKDSIVPIKSEQPFTDRLLFGIGRR
jgi:hypothetical protein